MFSVVHSDSHPMLLFFVQKYPARVGNRRYFERFNIWILERETLTRTLRKRCQRSTLASAAVAGWHLKRDWSGITSGQGARLRTSGIQIFDRPVDATNTAHGIRDMPNIPQYRTLSCQMRATKHYDCGNPMRLHFTVPSHLMSCRQHIRREINLSSSWRIWHHNYT